MEKITSSRFTTPDKNINKLTLRTASNQILQVYFLDGLLFAKALPWYKQHIRGPHLPFEHLEQDLRNKSGWPPVGACKNNEAKIGG